MNHEEFERELRYRVTLLAAKTMRKKGLISEEEYERIDSELLEKYRPVLGMLLAGKSGGKME